MAVFAKESITLAVSVCTLGATTLGLVGGYYKFKTYEERLLAIQTSTQEQESLLKTAEAVKATTPILEIGPRLVSQLNPYAYRKRGLRYVNLRLNLKNIGMTPVELGKVILRVHDGEPPEELAKKTPGQSRTRRVDSRACASKR